MPAGGEDTDLFCVEVSALAQQGPKAMPAALQHQHLVHHQQQQQQQQRVSCNGWQQHQQQLEEEETFPTKISSADQAHEDLLTSVLLKKDEYRPLQTSLRCMEDPEFLDIRGAVVNWFATVSASFGFVNETVVAALSHFDRYVSVTMTPIRDHMLLQLVAYVALLIASKMCETCPLRMKSLANLTGCMFTPLQVKRVEMDMISKLSFRLAPPSADETLHCLSALLHNNNNTSSSSYGDTSPPASSSSSPSCSSGGDGGVPHADILSAGSQYLKKARARTCWLRHSPYTLAVAALATAYNSLGLRTLRRRLLRESDARARVVTGGGVDIHGVAACADAMATDERLSAAIAAAAAAAAAAATTRRQGRGGGTESPACGGGDSRNKAAKDGWGSPTGVAQGAAELLHKAAFSTVVGNRGEGEGCTTVKRRRNDGGGLVGTGGHDILPLVVDDFSPPPSRTSLSPCRPVPIKAAAAAAATSQVMMDDRGVVRGVASSPRAASVVAAAMVSRKKTQVSRSPRDIAAPTGGRTRTARRVQVPTSPLDVERAAPRLVTAVTAAAAAAAGPLRVAIAPQPYPTLGEAPLGQSGGGGSGSGGHKRRLHQSIGSCFVPCARRRSVEGMVSRRLDISHMGTEERAV